MSKKFVFKLQNKSVQLDLLSSDIKKITLKFIGFYKKKIRFNAKVYIKLNPCNVNKLIEKVEIIELEINKNDDNSFKYNIYTLDCFSSSSSLSSVSDDKIYNQVIKFIKNIKFIIKDQQLTRMVFTLEKTDITKIKAKGIIH